jgi:hypothetical protein
MACQANTVSNTETHDAPKTPINRLLERGRSTIDSKEGSKADLREEVSNRTFGLARRAANELWCRDAEHGHLQLSGDGPSQ